jgi:hypothetical protein
MTAAPTAEPLQTFQRGNRVTDWGKFGNISIGMNHLGDVQVIPHPTRASASHLNACFIVRGTSTPHGLSLHWVWEVLWTQDRAQ